jgi:hypothetical protein
MSDGAIGVIFVDKGEPKLVVPYRGFKMEISGIEAVAEPVFIPEDPDYIYAAYKGADEIMELLKSLDIFRGTKLTHQEEEK